MERKVAVEVGLDERIFVLASIHRIDGLHASVETDDKVVEVESDTYPICHGQLLVESVEAERAFLLSFVFADVPDITGINESCTVEFLE